MIFQHRGITRQQGPLPLSLGGLGIWQDTSFLFLAEAGAGLLSGLLTEGRRKTQNCSRGLVEKVAGCELVGGPSDFRWLDLAFQSSLSGWTSIHPDSSNGHTQVLHTFHPGRILTASPAERMLSPSEAGGSLGIGLAWVPCHLEPMAVAGCAMPDC